MTKYTNAFDLFKANCFTEKEAQAVKDWFDELASHLQDLGCLVDLTAPIADLIGGDFFIVEDRSQLIQFFGPVPLIADNWGNLSDTGMWFTVINNNSGGPTFFIIKDAFIALKADDNFDRMFPKESYAGNNRR